MAFASRQDEVKGLRGQVLPFELYADGEAEVANALHEGLVAAVLWRVPIEYFGLEASLQQVHLHEAQQSVLFQAQSVGDNLDTLLQLVRFELLVALALDHVHVVDGLLELSLPLDRHAEGLVGGAGAGKACFGVITELLAIQIVFHIVDAMKDESVPLLRRALLEGCVVLDIRPVAVMSPHGNQLHVLFGWHSKFVLVLLGYVVEVDVCDGVVASVGQVQVEVPRAIEINPVFSIRIVAWNIVWLEHLRFELLLLEQQLLHHLLTYVDAVLRLLLF